MSQKCKYLRVKAAYDSYIVQQNILKMSIYSGFATRKLEQRYNILITQIMELLTQLIISYVQRNKIQPFEKQFRKLYFNMQKMDQLKHLEPKFSQVLKPLSQHIFLEDEQRPQTVPQPSNIIHFRDNKPRRPMTSNNFIQDRERKHSIQLQRKTINVLPERERRKESSQRYEKDQRKKIRHYSFSVKRTSQNYANYVNFNPFKLQKEKDKELQLGNNLTMEELMEKNRLVQRKMTLFRKKKAMQNKISKIPQLDQEEDSSQFV